jgi:AraC-like DNA-binding protein
MERAVGGVDHPCAVRLAKRNRNDTVPDMIAHPSSLPKVHVANSSAQLRPFVRRFLIVESRSERRDEHLPDIGAVAAFTFRGSCRWGRGDLVPHLAITGLWDTTRSHEHSGDHAVLLVQFTATGTAALLRESLDQFANTTSDLAEVLGRSANATEHLPDRLAAHDDNRRRIAMVEDFLAQQLRDARPDSLVQAAVAAIDHAVGTIRMSEVTRRVGLSQSALERRFRRVVGVSPRKYASLARLRHVVRLEAAGADFTTVAHAAGYSDQSHFIHDFKRFTGIAPRAYFRGDRGGECERTAADAEFLQV